MFFPYIHITRKVDNTFDLSVFLKETYTSYYDPEECERYIYLNEDDLIFTYEKEILSLKILIVIAFNDEEGFLENEGGKYLTDSEIIDKVKGMLDYVIFDVDFQYTSLKGEEELQKHIQYIVEDEKP